MAVVGAREACSREKRGRGRGEEGRASQKPGAAGDIRRQHLERVRDCERGSAVGRAIVQSSPTVNKNTGQEDGAKNICMHAGGEREREQDRESGHCMMYSHFIILSFSLLLNVKYEGRLDVPFACPAVSLLPGAERERTRNRIKSLLSCETVEQNCFAAYTHTNHRPF